MSVETIDSCRACAGRSLQLVLDLGSTPLANALLDTAEGIAAEPVFPLTLWFCTDCSLVQIRETVEPTQLFGEYNYFSSNSDTMLRHAADLVVSTVRDRCLDSDSLVVEIASNDGYLLRNYVAAGIRVLGIEPAANIAVVAEEAGVNTLNDFFGLPLATRLASDGVRADVIHAHNVLAHVADLRGVVEGIQRLLSPAGTAIIEVPYVRDLVERREFDTIYHEHLCYFSLGALNRLFRSHGLQIWDAERVSIHGGTLRIRARPESDQAPNLSVEQLLREESELGMDRMDYYSDFADRVQELRRDLTATLADLRRKGLRIAAYGAAAKGSTLLNFFGIGRDTIDFVVDRSTAKQGKYMPGVHIPVLPPTALLERRPDRVLLLTWNFAEEILEQQSEYRAAGGRFILPLPQVRVV